MAGNPRKRLKRERSRNPTDEERARILKNDPVQLGATARRYDWKAEQHRPIPRLDTLPLNKHILDYLSPVSIRFLRHVAARDTETIELMERQPGFEIVIFTLRSLALLDPDQPLHRHNITMSGRHIVERFS